MMSEENKDIDVLDRYFEIASGHACAQCPAPSDAALTEAINAVKNIRKKLAMQDKEIKAFAEEVCGLEKRNAWRDISEAPKDGTKFLGYVPQPHPKYCQDAVQVFVYDTYRDYRGGSGGTFRTPDAAGHGFNKPTMFLPYQPPFPAPPKEKSFNDVFEEEMQARGGA
jgi:hypothetical protein